MDLAERFAKMAAYADDLVMPPYIRDQVKQHFEYFRIQALCHEDRRMSQRALAMSWCTVKQDKYALAIIRKFAADLAFFAPVAQFVGDTLGDIAEMRTAAGIPSFPTAPNARPAPRVADASTPNFTRFFEGLRAKAHAKIQDPNQKHVATLALSYLALAAKLPEPERNLGYVRSVWKSVWPILEHHRLMDEFKGNDVLKRRFQSFLAGS